MAALGTRYVVATYDALDATMGAQLAVAAAENDTEVTVTVRVMKTTTCGNVTLRTNAQTQLTFLLHAQEVVRVVCDGDVTGSYVTSTKPVAVVSGNVCSQVPLHRPYCDHLVEMMVPVSALGTRYLLHTFQGRDNGAIYRIVPSEEETQINYGPGLMPYYVGDLPFHQFQLDQGQSGHVSTDKPVLVVGYALGGQMDTNSPYKGDPLMTLLPSPDLAPSDYVLDFDLSRHHSNGTLTCYFTAVVNFSDSQGVRVGGQQLVMEQAEDGFAVGSQQILSWPTQVYHDNPQTSIALSTYCFTDGEGIGFPAGYTLNDFTGQDECASSPCDNGGVCYGVGSSFRCRCVDVYGGQLCQQDVVNECDSTPCVNGATCQDGLRSFSCSCPPGYTGLTCDDVIETTTEPATTTTESITTDTTALLTTEPATTTAAPTTTRAQPQETTRVTHEVPPPPPKRMCPCSCKNVQLVTSQPVNNATTVEQQQEEIVQEIKEELAVDAKNTSKRRNQKQSAVDRRTSATGVGLVSVSLLALVLGFVVVTDTATLVSFIVRKLRQHRKKSLKANNPRSLEVKDSDFDAASGDPVGHGEQGSHRELAAACSLGSGAGDNGLTRVEVSRFVESVAMEGCHGNSPPKHRGSRRKHLLHVRPDTILLHVTNPQ
ncbi:uncharacterized protein [Littorina saxatilis]|uniref:uncharacterized protein isoform X2 n=1 Tax=Littorina saxatilis TaxID=31220 RepID=UPI0038B529F2